MAKELLGLMTWAPHAARIKRGEEAAAELTSRPLSTSSQIISARSLLLLLQARETKLLQSLSRAMAAATKKGGDEDYFDEWMKRQSDIVQAAALAFAEREVYESCLRAVEAAPASIKHVLSSLVQIFALRAIEIDLPFLIGEGLLPAIAGKVVPDAVRTAVAAVTQLEAQAVVDSFAIPDHLVAAPIAGDWERYNAADNKGELVGVH